MVTERDYSKQLKNELQFDSIFHCYPTKIAMKFKPSELSRVSKIAFIPLHFNIEVKWACSCLL